jgi:signal transduction histidine kinase
VLCVGAEPGRECREVEEWLLSALADQVTLALEYARIGDAPARAPGRATTPLDPDEPSGNRALATLAHDVRSGLHAVEAYAELMNMEVYGPVTGQQRDALARIRASSQHIVGVLENVLEMARLNAGAVRVRPDRVRARQVLDEVDLILRPTALARRQRVEMDPGPDPVLWADPDRVRQVLVNLLSNAIKFTPPGGRIRVSAEVARTDAGNEARIAVADSGPGIPEAVREQLFEPFVTTKPPGKGTGLGLAVCQALVSRLGGSILAENRVPRGACFHVRLPRAARGAAAR